MVYRESNNQDEGDLQTGTRVCKRCGLRKPMTEFHFANGGRHRRRQCKVCNDEIRKERWTNDPEKYKRLGRISYLRNNYGLEERDIDQMVEEQDGKCAICRTNPVGLQVGHIDHCHETGKVRGMLCFTCNTALGKFRNDTEVLGNAIRYLKGEKP